MKYYPGFNRFDLFDDFFSDATTKTANVLKTDIHEKDGYYVLSMEAPGVKKEDIQIELKDGYLKVTASRNSSKEDKDEKGKSSSEKVEQDVKNVILEAALVASM